MKKINNAFTLIELVVAATILVVLTSIGFYTYTQNISDARDSTRKIDIAALGSQIALHKKQRGSYPLPGDTFEIHNRWEVVAYQWFMNNKVALTTANSIPKDPDIDRFYTYSTSTNRQEYEIALSLENNEDPYAIVDGSYKSVAKNILPSLVLATWSTTPIEINSAVWAWATNRNLFVLDTWYHTLPYDFINEDPYTDGSDFTTILDDVSDNYRQNTDFISCDEIYLAKKHITPDDGSTSDEYQIRDSTGVLTNTGCTFP